MMTKQNTWRLVGALIAVIVIIKDQLSKWWLITHYFGDLFKDGSAPNFLNWWTMSSARWEHDATKITDFFNIVLVWNQGISFGMLHTDTNIMIYILSAMAVAVAVGFYVWLWREPRPFLAVCIGLIVGGALGNVLDRLRFGAVIDFLDVHAAGYHWPAFNVADASISLGVVLLIVDMLFFSSKTSRGGVVNESV